MKNDYMKKYTQHMLILVIKKKKTRAKGFIEKIGPQVMSIDHFKNRNN